MTKYHLKVTINNPNVAKSVKLLKAIGVMFEFVPRGELGDFLFKFDDEDQARLALGQAQQAFPEAACTLGPPQNGQRHAQ